MKARVDEGEGVDGDGLDEGLGGGSSCRRSAWAPCGSGLTSGEEGQQPCAR